MTDKVQKIREEIEKRYEYWKEKEFNSHSIESEIRMSECQHLLLIIDSLQNKPCNHCQGHNNKEECDALVFGHNCPIVKKPISKDLEEAAIAYNKKAVTAHNKRVNFVVVGNVPNEHFIAGAKWQEQQMMSKAIDAKLLEGHLIRQKDVTHPLHVGDKVKIIVIKED